MMTSKLPVISIITPTYNRADELEYLYKSLNQQSVDSKIFEFIISDDGSTDSSLKLVKKMKSPFIKILSNKKNKGIGY